MGNAGKGPQPCPTCGGTGCPVCKGSGVASQRVGRWGRGYREEQAGPEEWVEGEERTDPEEWTRPDDEWDPDAPTPPGMPEPPGGVRSRVGVLVRWLWRLLVLVVVAALAVLVVDLVGLGGPPLALVVGVVVLLVLWRLLR